MIFTKYTMTAIKFTLGSSINMAIIKLLAIQKRIDYIPVTVLATLPTRTAYQGESFAL